jgi:hypothetical protein
MCVEYIEIEYDIQMYGGRGEGGREGGEGEGEMNE